MPRKILMRLTVLTTFDYNYIIITVSLIAFLHETITIKSYMNLDLDE